MINEKGTIDLNDAVSSGDVTLLCLRWKSNVVPLP